MEGKLDALIQEALKEESSENLFSFGLNMIANIKICTYFFHLIAENMKSPSFVELLYYEAYSYCDAHWQKQTLKLYTFTGKKRK